ncbi:MAG: acyl-CoA dehydrogenase, partial [Chrysiogenales bacterium]
MEEKEFSFGMSEEQRTMKETVARLVKANVTDVAHDMDETKALNPDLIQKIWELGAVISIIPEEYGGYGMDYSPVMNAIILEELAYGDMALAIASTLPSLFLYPVMDMGSAAQKKKYIPPYCDPEFKACTAAINEPNFKFDPVCPSTKAEKKGSSYIINGNKCFVPMAPESGHMLVSAETDGKTELFIVAADNPGLKIGDRENNLGLYALRSFPVSFENCEVPATDRLGEGQGSDHDRYLQKTRIALAAIGAGVSRASFEYARDYSKERIQFGEPIASRQAVAFMLAEMAYEVDAIRLMAWQGASALEAGRDARRESYLAKLYAGEMTMKITDFGV